MDCFCKYREDFFCSYVSGKVYTSFVFYIRQAKSTKFTDFIYVGYLDYVDGNI